MTTIRIAAAQSPSVPMDIEANVQLHLKFIASARQANVDILAFPELSVCGYELPHLSACVVAPDDVLLAPIQAMAVEAGMTIIVGAAVAGEKAGLPSIGSIVYSPGGATSIYRKRYLHPGEEQFVQAGTIDAFRLHENGHAFSLAICADTTHRAHAVAAAAEGASLYLASVLISENGYALDSSLLRQYSVDFKMGVLLANHAAPSGGFASAGRSAFWDSDGELVVAADGPGNCLVVIDNEAGRWEGGIVEVDI
ncbi:carbon-nitrogen hydrolase family protein [Herbaspirillum sp. NPDC101397]|uniref:carbon-nitrogen hydrolase family protein n=1 Tax=Herbaspirillum sp. NPDC101397 TaxID=3364006 RepID=UPI00383BC7FF